MADLFIDFKIRYNLIYQRSITNSFQLALVRFHKLLMLFFLQVINCLKQI